MHTADYWRTSGIHEGMPGLQESTTDQDNVGVQRPKNTGSLLLPTYLHMGMGGLTNWNQQRLFSRMPVKAFGAIMTHVKHD